MIECYESNCPYHLNTEPYCGEVECLRRATNASEDGIELDMTEYDLRGSTPGDSRVENLRGNTPVQLGFQWGAK